MNKRAFIGWFIGVPLLVLILMIVIVKHEPEGEGLSRAAAYRAVTLALCSGKELEEWKESEYTSLFSAKEQEQWYVPYVDYLYCNGYFDSGQQPEQKTMISNITYGELQTLFLQIPDLSEKFFRVSKNNLNKNYPRDEFGDLYLQLCAAIDKDVNCEGMKIYGTPGNISSAPPWTAYTDKGTMSFDGLALDSCLDHEIEGIYCDNNLIWINNVVSDRVIYKNVWLMEGTADDLLVFVGPIKRELAYEGSKNHEKLYNQVADIQLKAGKLEKITIKKERISPRVLAVNDNYLELEEYGRLELDEGFRVLKTYGEFEEQNLKDIMVGYNMQEFVVAEGKICAALTVREFDAEQIRVLLMNTGFKKATHERVQLQCDDQMTMIVGDQSSVIPAGEILEFSSETEVLLTNRVILRSGGSAGIRILSIERAQGQPVYQGQIEIAAEEEGLVIVNDIYLEDYLKYVVPSEMSAGYEKEALRAQAVCARTYAYVQMMGKQYHSYGAHVDDSTNYQVYNNIKTDPRTDAAVQETYGEMLLYEGEPFLAYYFSTSCGTTTDGTVWGVEASQTPFLKSVLLQGSRETIDLTSNERFSNFIKNKDYPSYDSDFALYRWRTTIRADRLAEKVSDIGVIKSIRVTERGTGGFVKQLEIVGSEGTKTYGKQSEVRSILGDVTTPIIKNDGGEMTEWSALPSAYITVESAGAGDDGVVTFIIYGGGYGHGAGMSQNGAQGMAKKGKNYLEILNFFYEGITVGGR